MSLVLKGRSCTHAEEPKGSTEDWTKKRRFGIDILWRSNCFNDLPDNTAAIDCQSLVGLMLPRYSASTVYSHCLGLTVEKRLVVIGKVLVYCYMTLASKSSRKLFISDGSL